MEHAFEGGAAAEDFAEGTGGLHLFAEVVALEFQLAAEGFILFKRARVGDGDGGGGGHGMEPVETFVIGGGAPEDGKDAERLAAEDERVAGETFEAFGLGPGGMADPELILGQAGDTDGFAGGGDVGDFEVAAGEGDAVECAVDAGPIGLLCSRGTGAGAEMESGFGIGIGLADGAGFGGFAQPKAGEGDAGLAGDGVDDGSEYG